MHSDRHHTLLYGNWLALILVCLLHFSPLLLHLMSLILLHVLNLLFAVALMLQQKLKLA